MMFTDAQKALIKLAAFCLWSLALIIGTSLYVAGELGEAAKLEKARAVAAALQAQAVEHAQLLAGERALRAADAQKFTVFKQEQDRAQAEKDRFISDLRRDVVRLRVPIRPRAPEGTPGTRPAATGSGDEGHAELTADAAQFVVDLLARGDTAIRKHGEVVDRYERLRLTCNNPTGAAP